MDKVKRIQELRRSNAATPLRNKKKYTRKEKYKNRLDNQIKIGMACQGDTPSYECDFNHLELNRTNWTNVF